MLRIPCPWCGTRDELEFVFGGQAHRVRPGAAVDDAVWTEYLFTRENPVGLHLERWSHAYGCGRWFNMARDTRTHAILKVYRPGEPRPEVGAEHG